MFCKKCDVLERYFPLVFLVDIMKDKSHKEFIDCFKNIVKSIQLVDIPNQKGAISKEEFTN